MVGKRPFYTDDAKIYQTTEGILTIRVGKFLSTVFGIWALNSRDSGLEAMILNKSSYSVTSCMTHF